MRIAVLGPGGVGGLLAGLLARGGDVVTCLAGETTAATLRSQGITVRSDRFGAFTVPVAAATVLEEPVDACLVTVKATQLEQALDRVPVDALEDALVVPFLNGVEHVETLRQRYPTAVVTPGTIRVESLRRAAGVIEHASPFAMIEMATSAGGSGSVQRLEGHLRRCGLDVQVREDETAMLWDKLVFLAPMALLTTHGATPVGVVRTEQRDDLLAIVEEITTVAGRLGAQIDATAVAAILDAVPAGMQSSMQRDAEAGRATELEAIGGAVVRAAQRVGVAVPVTARFVTALRGHGSGGDSVR